MQNRHFSSFPTRTEFTPLPDFFFTQVMPQIQDTAELKVTMCIFYILSKAKNLYEREYPPFVTYRELLSHIASMPEMKEKTLRHALGLAVDHGAILRLNLNIDGKWEEAYFANIESDREAIDNIKRGKLSVKPRNIFLLYEQNIGIITPIIAEELTEAEKLYPPQWIEEAFREAAMVNKRSWKYIARILERWASEGKDSGEHRQSTKTSSPDKYIRGKYGHLVKR